MHVDNRAVWANALHERWLWVMDQACMMSKTLLWPPVAATRLLCVAYGCKICRFAPEPREIAGATAQRSSICVTQPHRRGLWDP